MSDSTDVRVVLLETITKMGANPFHHDILTQAGKRLNAGNNEAIQQAILAQWQNLFTSGLLAWGRNLENPDPPAFHFTDRGKETLKHLSRDPSNPDGYMAYLDENSQLDPIAASYIREAIQTYQTSCYKATAVLLGCAAERFILLLRDSAQAKLDSLGRSPNKTLSDWRVKTVFDELSDILKTAMDKEIKASGNADLKKFRESFVYQWPALFHQIRASRNDVGHPNAIAPVTPEDVHAGLLTFPHLARMVQQLNAWIPTAPL